MTTTFPALTEVEGKLKAKQDELGSIFKEAGPDLDLSKVKSVAGAADSKAVAEHIRSLNDECTDLAKERESLLAVQKAADFATTRPDGAGVEPGAGQKATPGAPSTKSLGDLFTESDAFKTKGRTSELDMDLKTLLSRAAGWAPESTRGPRIVDFATPAPQQG